MWVPNSHSKNMSVHLLHKTIWQRAKLGFQLKKKQKQKKTEI